MLRFSAPMMSGEYIHISEAAQCPAVQDLTVKVDSLTSQVKDLTATNFKLQDRVDDLETIQVAARNNNILSDCISSAYLDILERVRQATKERIYSWGELMERAEVEQELQEHIRAAFVAAGFTETEWVALYNFKCSNEENHVQFQITKAYDIVTRITSASYIDDLKSGLNKAIAFHEARGGNWMQLYPY